MTETTRNDILGSDPVPWCASRAFISSAMVVAAAGYVGWYLRTK